LRWQFRKRIGLLFHAYLFLLGFNCNSFQIKTPLDIQSHKEYIIHLLQLDHEGEKYNRYTSNIYVKDDFHKIHHFKTYTYLSSSLKDIRMGDVILTFNKPNPIQTIYNPGSFKFAEFSKRNGIHYSLFLNNNAEWVELKHQQNSYLSALHFMRKWIIKTIQNQLKNPAEAGLTEALLIGYKEDLDDRLQEQYTLTGISHIIAVSGMHLGLIFSVLAGLFKLILKRKTARYLGFGIILPFLWAFAFISGASASVLRSVMVFSIVLWGNVLLKKSGSINALFASAFILLVYKPSFISDIGFQLSYAAVLSILIYEPLISNCIYVKNKMMKQLWSMVSITLAAQILTTPIVLFHFKQFPVLFLITNLVAVPLSNIVLLLTILLCLASTVLIPTQPIVFIIHICIKMMNSYIEKVATISFNTIQIQISLAIIICLYATIAFLTYYSVHKQRASPLPVLISVFLLSLFYQINQYQIIGTKRILILQLKDATCIIHQHGKKGILLASLKLINNKLLFKKQLRSLSNDLGIIDLKVSPLKEQSAIITLKLANRDKKALLLTGFKQKIPPLKQLLDKTEIPKQLIADGSIKLWKIKQWEKQAQEVHLPLHSTQEKGAFILSCEHR